MKCNNEVDYYNGGWVEIFNILKNLYTMTFKYENLPTTVSTRFLETSLFDNGSVAFFKDEEVGFLTLKFIPEGMLNVYGEPIKVRVFGSNGYQRVLTNNVDCILIYNNYIRNSPIKRLQDYAKRIYQMEHTIDLNVKNQRFPLVMTTNKNKKLSLQNIYRKYKGFEDCIIVDESLDLDSIRVLKTDSPYIVDKLMVDKKKLWNEVLSYIGIDNNSSEKNERLTDEEVLISNGLAISNRQSRFLEREKGIEKINKLWGLDIEVVYNNLAFVKNESTSEGGELIDE